MKRLMVSTPTIMLAGLLAAQPASAIETDTKQELTALTTTVSYTHLTLPTNREV